MITNCNFLLNIWIYSERLRLKKSQNTNDEQKYTNWYIDVHNIQTIV